MTKIIRNETEKLEVVFILDRSGSMSGLEADTIGGFNSTLKKQKDIPGEVIWSTVLFDDRFEILHDRKPIQEVENLTENDYYVRGSTALLDAIGRSILHIDNIQKNEKVKDAPEKTMFIITTDGMENASREFTYAKVKELIDQKIEKNGWEFIFLGANMDAVSVAGRMGIRASRAASFTNDSEGISVNYDAISRAVSSMRFCKSMDESALDAVREDHKSRKHK